LEVLDGITDPGQGMTEIVGAFRQSLRRSEVEELRAYWRRLPFFNTSNPSARTGAGIGQSPVEPYLTIGTVIMVALRDLCETLSRELVLVLRRGRLPVRS
jgi:hypothetical protein